uniref:Uncharacterized protein n=1 Tax=Psilocybe cubensis TaxID=181762 RepID=A0A8H8CHG6_PSICU
MLCMLDTPPRDAEVEHSNADADASFLYVYLSASSNVQLATRNLQLATLPTRPLALFAMLRPPVLFDVLRPPVLFDVLRYYVYQHTNETHERTTTV